MSRTEAAGRGGGGDPAVTLMLSPEPLLLLEAERDIRDRLIPEGERDLNYLMLYGWEAEPGSVLEFLQTMPFLGSRRLLVIREVEKFRDVDLLEDYLADPNPQSILLLTSSEFKRTDKRYKFLSSRAKVVEKRRLSGRALVKWVEERFRNAGKSIDPSHVEILIQKAGGNLGFLAGDIEKVILSSGSADKIDQRDLAVSVPGGAQVVFDLLDAVGEGDRKQAITSMRALLVDDSPPEYLVHMMAWHFRQLLKGRELVDSGLSPSQAAMKLGKKYPALREKFARQVERATEGELVRAMEALADCDRGLKSGRVPPETLMDRLVLELLVG